LLTPGNPAARTIWILSYCLCTYAERAGSNWISVLSARDVPPCEATYGYKYTKNPVYTVMVKALSEVNY
jgi:hypothetical protein